MTDSLSQALTHHRTFMAAQDLQFRAENDQRAAGLRVSLGEYEPTSVRDMAFGVTWAVESALELFEATGASLTEKAFTGVQKMSIAAMTIVEDEVRKADEAGDGPEYADEQMAARVVASIEEHQRLLYFEQHVRTRAHNVGVRATTAVAEADRLWRSQHSEETETP